MFFSLLSGNISEKSRILTKAGSTLSTNDDSKPQTSSKQENIEMSVLQKNTQDASLSTDSKRVSMGNVTDEAMTSGDYTSPDKNLVLPEGYVSPVISESFLNAPVAVSSSPATSPDVPPPLPSTPIPSDEDLSGNAGQRVIPRHALSMRQRFAEIVNQENKGRFDHPLRPRSPLIDKRYKCESI